MEHGPTTASRRSSAPCSTRWIAWRAVVPVAGAAASVGSCSSKSCGGMSARTAEMRKSSVRPTTVVGSESPILVALWDSDPCFPAIFISFLHRHAPISRRLGEPVEQFDSFGPSQARIRDRHAVLELLARHQVLASLVEMALDHHPDDAPLALGELCRAAAADFDPPLCV